MLNQPFIDKFIRYLNVVPSLGIRKSLYVSFYKFTLKYRLRSRLISSHAMIPEGSFFQVNQPPSVYKIPENSRSMELADKIREGEFTFFGRHKKKVGSPPDWLVNPFNNQRAIGNNTLWPDIPDFSEKVGDIKCIWELSRFEWVLPLAVAYCNSGDGKYLATLNNFVSDWIKNNPVNKGVNWKCGQEASIRCFNLMLAWKLFSYPELGDTAVSFFKAHLKRIQENITYALCQDNNHGTSEAAALYLIGLTLSRVTRREDLYADSIYKGRKLLESLVSRLISKDGSFSQHSINYHRLMLDTLSLVEMLRIDFNAPAFSKSFYEKYQKATEWLQAFVDPRTGDAPNLGANDGACICNIESAPIRDFRPSVQWAYALLHEKRLYEPGPYDLRCQIFNIAQTSSVSALKFYNDTFFYDGGYAKLVNQESVLFIRASKYVFRPSQADQMHVDLWHRGMPILIDAGTYSYNDSEGLGKKLKSSVSHNTAVFDNADPMPTVSRFLYSHWLKGEMYEVSDGVTLRYTDYRKFSHQRKITKTNFGFIIDDTFSGAYRTASIFWHLGVPNWTLHENEITVGDVRLRFGPTNNFELALNDSVFSRYYLDAQQNKSVEIKLNASTKSFLTEIHCT